MTFLLMAVHEAFVKHSLRVCFILEFGDNFALRRVLYNCSVPVQFQQGAFFTFHTPFSFPMFTLYIYTATIKIPETA